MRAACPVCRRWHGPDPTGGALTLHRIALLLAAPEAIAAWLAWRTAALGRNSVKHQHLGGV